MGIFNCGCTCRCPILAIIASAVVGVVAAFLQILGTITVTPAFLWVALGIAVVYLAVLLVRRTDVGGCECRCANLATLLAGILGTILFSLVLLAVGVVATSVVSAILVGVLLFFLALTFTAAACAVRCENC